MYRTSTYIDHRRNGSTHQYRDTIVVTHDADVYGDVNTVCLWYTGGASSTLDTNTHPESNRNNMTSTAWAHEEPPIWTLTIRLQQGCARCKSPNFMKSRTVGRRVGDIIGRTCQPLIIRHSEQRCASCVRSQQCQLLMKKIKKQLLYQAAIKMY